MIISHGHRNHDSVSVSVSEAASMVLSLLSNFTVGFLFNKDITICSSSSARLLSSFDSSFAVQLLELFCDF